jgi:hypothetical protein
MPSHTGATGRKRCRRLSPYSPQPSRDCIEAVAQVLDRGRLDCRDRRVLAKRRRSASTASAAIPGADHGGVLGRVVINSSGPDHDAWLSAAPAEAAEERTSAKVRDAPPPDSCTATTHSSETAGSLACRSHPGIGRRPERVPAHGKGRRFNRYGAHHRFEVSRSQPLRTMRLDRHGFHEADRRGGRYYAAQMKACRLQKNPVFILGALAAAEICEHQKIKHLGKRRLVS